MCRVALDVFSVWPVAFLFLLYARACVAALMSGSCGDGGSRRARECLTELEDDGNVHLLLTYQPTP